MGCALMCTWNIWISFPDVILCDLSLHQCIKIRHLIWGWRLYRLWCYKARTLILTNKNYKQNVPKVPAEPSNFWTARNFSSVFFPRIGKGPWPIRWISQSVGSNAGSSFFGRKLSFSRIHNVKVNVKKSLIIIIK